MRHTLSERPRGKWYVRPAFRSGPALGGSMSHDSRKRVGVLLLIGAVLVPLAIVSTAWACGRLATLRLSADSARTGQEITGFGGNYNSVASSSDVTVRLGGRSGRVLWQG